MKKIALVIAALFAFAAFAEEAKTEAPANTETTTMPEGGKMDAKADKKMDAKVKKGKKKMEGKKKEEKHEEAAH